MEEPPHGGRPVSLLLPAEYVLMKRNRIKHFRSSPRTDPLPLVPENKGNYGKLMEQQPKGNVLFMFADMKFNNEAVMLQLKPKINIF